MQVELSFVNPLGDVNGLEVTYALYDGGGIRFFTGSAGGLDIEDIHFPSASQQFRMSADTREVLPSGVDEAAIRCSVLGIEEITNIRGYVRASGAETCAVVGTDRSGRLEVEVTAVSPYPETASIQVWWALLAPGQTRFDTQTGWVDFVSPGETFRVSPLYNPEKPAWIADGDVTCVVVGYWERP